MFNLIITVVLFTITVAVVFFMKKATEDASRAIGRFACTSLRKQMILGELDKQHTKRLVDYPDDFERK